MRQLGSVLVRLNLETRGYHAVADHAWLALVTGRPPARHDYMQALVRTYGFDAPLEAALRYTSEFDRQVDMTGRYRSGLIARDLLTLGLGPAQVSTIPQQMLAPFGSVAEALGWLYVHERATLVHERVRLELCRKARDLDHATSYLSAYTGVVGARFADLGQQLDRLARTPEVADIVVGAARDAFRHALAWLSPDLVAIA